MRLIEIPVLGLENEIEALSFEDGPNMKLFAMGAMVALEWVLHKGPAPSTRLLGVSKANRQTH